MCCGACWTARYDVLPRRFHEERNGADEYVPLRDRAPSVRTGLCRVVVEDSIALLFGEGRFPAIDCEDQPTRETLAALIKGTHLPAVMERPRCAALLAPSRC